MVNVVTGKVLGEKSDTGNRRDLWMRVISLFEGAVLDGAQRSEL